MTNSVEIRILGAADAQLLRACGEDVFDNSVSPELAAEFLADSRHHIAAAIVNGTLVGFVSAVHYVHPDKSPELWINEVGVSESQRGRGIGRRLLETMLEHGKTIGCAEAWVVTEEDNVVAQRLYTSAGGTDRKVVYFTFPLGTKATRMPASGEGGLQPGVDLTNSSTLLDIMEQP